MGATVPPDFMSALAKAAADRTAGSQPSGVPTALNERSMTDPDIQKHLEDVAQTLLDRGVAPKDIVPVIQRQHAFLTGRLGQSVQRANNLEDAPAIDAGKGIGPAQEAASDVGAGLEHVGQAITLGGAKYAYAAPRALATGQSYKQALGDENQEMSQLSADHPLASAGLEVAGGMLNPLTAIATAKRLKAAGTLGKVVLGAGEGAVQGGARAAVESGGDPDAILHGAGWGGVAGGVLTPVVGAVGRGVANVSKRTGLTDAISQGLENAAPTLRKIPGLDLGANASDLAAATGTRGQVNATMGQREDLLNTLGANGKTAAKTQLDRIAETKAKADVLYGQARADKTVVDDPRVAELLKDPEVQKVFQTVKALRAAKGEALPEVNDLSSPPQAQANKLIRPEDWAAMVAKPENAAALKSLPTGLSGLTTSTLPDPEALSMMKRYLGAASKGLDSPLQLTQDKAIATMDKVTQLRNVLHEVSEPWKTADAFYADAKGQEEAFNDGYNAFRGVKNVSGDNLPDKSAEAMEQTITTPRYKDEPPEATANRADAFKAGVRARQVDQVRGAPVDQGNKSALNVPSLSPDEVTMGVRKLGGSTPAVERTLAERRAFAESIPSDRSMNYAPMTVYSAARQAIRKLVQPPDLLASPAGGAMIADRTGNQALRASEITRSQHGQAMLDALKEIASRAGRKGLPAVAGGLSGNP
jgi:hypothetical protein